MHAACHNCGATSWQTDLIYWNVQRVDPGTKERWLVLCGACLPYYKYDKEFCTICYKLYPIEDNVVISSSGSGSGHVIENSGVESGASNSTEVVAAGMCEYKPCY
jgi:hypothetical protein